MVEERDKYWYKSLYFRERIAVELRFTAPQANSQASLVQRRGPTTRLLGPDPLTQDEVNSTFFQFSNCASSKECSHRLDIQQTRPYQKEELGFNTLFHMVSQHIRKLKQADFNIESV